LEPGESKTVRFQIHPDLLRFYNSDLEWVVEPGGFQVFVGSNARDVLKLGFEYR
jgi:beta-glucosidase